MKYLSIFLLLFLTYPLQAQNPFPMDSASNKVQYQETISVQSATAPQLRQKAKDWLTTKTKSTIRLDEANLLMATLVHKYVESPESAQSMQVNLYVPLTLELKNGQYTYTITNLKASSAVAGQSNDQWDLENIANDFLPKEDLKGAQGLDRAIRQDIIELLKRAMASK